MASCNDGTCLTSESPNPRRSISLSNAEVKKVEDKKHSSAMLQGLYQSYKEERFCDVTLVFGDKEIKAHKVALASASIYFKAMFSSNFKDGLQQKLEIPVLDCDIGTALIEYVYTGEIEITADNVVELLAGANFMQGFDFIEKVCCDFLKKHMNDDNVIAILQIADQYHQTKLKDYTKSQCFLKFAKFAESEAFLNIPFKLMKELMSDDHILVEKKGVVYLGRKQEEYLLERVLKYIKHNQEVGQKAAELLESIHLPLLKKKKLEMLKSNDLLQGKECETLVDRAIMLIKLKKNGKRSPEKLEKKEESEGLEKSNKNNGWTKQRPCGEYQLWKGCCLAAGEQVNDEPDPFNDESKIDVESDFVIGMDIWIRSWDSRSVIGGMKVYYSNGESSMHGDDTANTKEQFRLDPDERIVKLDSQSGWMIDCLTFYTNRDRKLGPYGGSGGGYRQENPPSLHGYLVCICATVVKAQGSLGITKLRFMWRIFREHDQSPVPDYTEPHNDEFDEDEYDDFFDDYEDYEGYDFEDDYDIEDENFYDYDPSMNGEDDWPLIF